MISVTLNFFISVIDYSKSAYFILDYLIILLNCNGYIMSGEIRR